MITNDLVWEPQLKSRLAHISHGSSSLRSNSKNCKYVVMFNNPTEICKRNSHMGHFWAHSMLPWLVITKKFLIHCYNDELHLEWVSGTGSLTWDIDECIGSVKINQIELLNTTILSASHDLGVFLSFLSDSFPLFCSDLKQLILFQISSLWYFDKQYSWKLLMKI